MSSTAAMTTMPPPTLASSLVGQGSVTPVLTTVFSPAATTCLENRLTMMENRAYEIWMNEPLPVPGKTFTECYPSQYMTSFLLSAGGITQPAFAPLKCPKNYFAVGPYTSNYIACCPTGYLLADPTETPFPDRPAFGGTCYTPIPMASPKIVTKYGYSDVLATVTFSATDISAQAYAYPIEGFAYGVKVPESLTAPATTTGASPGSTAAPVTYTVVANANPTFTPNTIEANIGDTILFQFMSGNHSVTQSTYEAPCAPLANGADSGFMENINDSTNPPPAFAFRVASTSPAYFYSKQAGDCGSGMTFALNPTTEQPQANFQAAAIQSSSKLSATKDGGLSTGAKAGIAIAIIIPVLILAILAFFFVRRRNRARAAEQHTPTEYYGEDTKSRDTYDSEVKEDRPMVPPKRSEMPGNSMASELPGYTTHEMMGSPGTHFDNELSPISPPTPAALSPLQQKPAYTHYDDNDD